MHIGTCLIIDSDTITIYVNKDVFIESIVERMRFNVVPFDERIGKLDFLPIVNAIHTYDNPNRFCIIILQIKHAIYIKYMKHALIHPNQSREYSTIIDNIPPHLYHTGTVTFTITSGDYNLPIEQYGPKAYICVRLQP